MMNMGNVGRAGNISRQQLHALVDMVEESAMNALYDLMVRFIPEDKPTQDEIEALKLGQEEFERGETMKLDDFMKSIKDM